MYRHALILAAALSLSPPAVGSILLAREDFQDFTGAGIAPGGGNGTLDSTVWSVAGASDGVAPFGATRLAGDLARGLSPGGERGGGLYAFMLPDARRGVGIQPTGSDFTPGAITHRLVNETGQGLDDLSALLELWFLDDGTRSTRMTVLASTATGPWLPVPGLALSTPAGGDASGWQGVTLRAVLPVAALAVDEELLLRWSFDDGAGSGSRDEIALSALQLRGTPMGAPATALPVPPAAALVLTGLAVMRGRRPGAVLRGGNAPESPW